MVMLISSQLLDIRENLPIRVITSLVTTLNRNNPEVIPQVSAEVILFLNRGFLLYSMLGNKELQKEVKSDFDLWKKYEVKQNLFFKLSDFKSSESNKFIDIISYLKVEMEDKGFIDPFQISIANRHVADFIANVVGQLSLKQTQQVTNDELKVTDDTLKKLTKEIKMSSLENQLRNNFEWEEQSFTNGCGKLNFEGGLSLLKPISPNFFKSLFVGSNKGHHMFLKNFLIDKQTIISFHPEKLVSSEFPKDKEVWESYFLNESIFLGFTKIDLDILGLPLKKLELTKHNLRDDFFNVNFLLLDQSDLDMTLLNLKNKKIFSITKTVIYACRAISFFIKKDINDPNKSKEKKGPWG